MSSSSHFPLETHQDFPGGPVVNTLPCNVGEFVGSIPGQGTKIPYAPEQLTPGATNKTWSSQINKGRRKKLTITI